jgi:hypothetical protein
MVLERVIPDVHDYTSQTRSVLTISGVTIPASKLVLEATELDRDTESELLFNQSNRVFYLALSPARGAA